MKNDDKNHVHHFEVFLKLKFVSYETVNLQNVLTSMPHDSYKRGESKLEKLNFSKQSPLNKQLVM